LSKEVSDVDQVIAGNIPTGDDQCRFDATILENVIKSLVEERLGDANAIMAETDFSDFKPCPRLSLLQVLPMPKGRRFYFGRMAVKDSVPTNAQFGQRLVVRVPLHLFSGLCLFTSQLQAAGISTAGYVITIHLKLL
jgi:hypothetical protein